MHRFIPGALIGSFVTASVVFPIHRHSPQSPDERLIRFARMAQNEAISHRDLDSAATFWVPNVVVTAGLGLAFQGSDVYRRAFTLDSTITYDREPDSITVSQAWPLAWEEGRWFGSRCADCKPLISRRYSAMWAKVGGRWFIRSELFVATHCTAAACAWPVAVR